MAPRVPKAFFAALAAAHALVEAEFQAEGRTIYRVDALPLSTWPNGWWDCRGFQAFGRDSTGWRRVEVALNPRDYRPLRRGKALYSVG